MVKKNLFFVTMGLLIFGAAFASAAPTDSMIVTVDVLATEIGIDVPDRLFFPNIAAGYLSEDRGFELLNTGTTDIRVTPTLSENYTGEIFENLKFDTVKTNPNMVKIGIFDVDILRPKIAGDQRVQQMYAWLDLTEYSQNIEENMQGHQATVVFTAMPL